MKRGDVVWKKTGYQGKWLVVVSFSTFGGETRLVCESMDLPGLLHIFNPEQVELVA